MTSVDAQHKCLREKVSPPEALYDNCTKLGSCLQPIQSTALKLVRKGGFEPPRLSAPPPQDGVSASSTTSALCEIICNQ